MPQGVRHACVNFFLLLLSTCDHSLCGALDGSIRLQTLYGLPKASTFTEGSQVLKHRAVSMMNFLENTLVSLAPYLFGISISRDLLFLDAS